MKKIVLSVMAVAALTALTSCSKKEKKAGDGASASGKTWIVATDTAFRPFE